MTGVAAGVIGPSLPIHTHRIYVITMIQSLENWCLKKAMRPSKPQLICISSLCNLLKKEPFSV